MKKMYICTMEYYSAIRKNEIESFVELWMAPGTLGSSPHLVWLPNGMSMSLNTLRLLLFYMSHVSWVNCFATFIIK